MKKNILIAFIFILMAISIFVTQFEISKQNEFKNLLSLGNGDNSKQIVFSYDNQDSQQVYSIVTHIIDKYGGNIYTISIDDNNNYTKYIYCNNLKYFEDINLSSGHFFKDKEDNSAAFLSTYKFSSPDQIGVIKPFETSRIFNIRTLKSNLNENSFRKIFTLVLENENDIEKLRKDLNEEEITFDILDDDTEQKNYRYFYVIVFTILYITLIIIILYDLLNSYKKIAVEKMLGFSNFKIWEKRIFPIMKIALLVFGICVVLCSIILFNEFNSLVFEFIKQIVHYYSVIIISTFIFSSLPFLYIKKIKIIYMLKNTRPTNTIICFNTALKVIISIFLLIVSVNLLNEFDILNNIHKEKFNNWENTKNYFVNNTIEYYEGTNGIDSFSTENIEICKSLYNTFNKQGGILAKFDKYRILDSKYKSGIDYQDNNIVINPNYLKSNIIYDINGNRVSISETESNCIILVPQKYNNRQKKILEYYKNILAGYESDSSNTIKEIKLIWIKNNQNFFTYKVNIYPNKNNCVQDPLAMVITESNANDLNYLEVLGTGNFLIKVSDNNVAINEINSIIGKYYDLSIYQFPLFSVYESMVERITESQNKIATYSIIMVILIILMSIIIIQNIANYFEQNKVRLAIKKFMGFKLKDKYSAFFISEICSLIISSCLAFLITKQLTIFIIASVTLIVELLFTIILLKINENKNILRITKGG